VKVKKEAGETRSGDIIRGGGKWWPEGYAEVNGRPLTKGVTCKNFGMRGSTGRLTGAKRSVSTIRGAMTPFNF